MFKLVNPKHKDQASIRNDCLSLNLLVSWVEICKTSVYVIDFRCDLSNDGEQKQVKATEAHLLWIFCKNHYQGIGDQYRRETVEQNFNSSYKVLHVRQ